MHRRYCNIEKKNRRYISQAVWHKYLEGLNFWETADNITADNMIFVKLHIKSNIKPYTIYDNIFT